MKKKYSQLNGNVSDFFIHTMSSWWMGIIAKLVMNDLSLKTLERFTQEYLEFGTAAWKRIMRIKIPQQRALIESK